MKNTTEKEANETIEKKLKNLNCNICEYRNNCYIARKFIYENVIINKIHGLCLKK